MVLSLVKVICSPFRLNYTILVVVKLSEDFFLTNIELSNDFCLDFTLSEIAISRTLRQAEDISINLNANEHPETSEIPSENISGSAHFNSHSPNMTTKQELTLDGSIPVNNAVTLKNFMEVQENYSGDASYIVSADETMPEKMQNKYSNYEKNVDPSFTDSSKIVKKEKIQIESLPAFSEESSEENQKRENTVIAQSEVHLEPTIGRIYADAAPKGETLVPRTEIVKNTHAGMMFLNNNS